MDCFVYNGSPYSFPFLKFVIPMLHCFRVCPPEILLMNELCMLDAILSTIESLLTDIPNRIFTCLMRKHERSLLREAPAAASVDADDPIIDRGELTRLWCEYQSKAIDVIKNYCRVPKHSHCTVDIRQTEERFAEKCTRHLDTLPSQAPWAEVVIHHQNGHYPPSCSPRRKF